jgi:hypothetical protein
MNPFISTHSLLQERKKEWFDEVHKMSFLWIYGIYTMQCSNEKKKIQYYVTVMNDVLLCE